MRFGVDALGLSSPRAALRAQVAHWFLHYHTISKGTILLDAAPLARRGYVVSLVQTSTISLDLYPAAA